MKLNKTSASFSFLADLRIADLSGGEDCLHQPAIAIHVDCGWHVNAEGKQSATNAAIRIMAKDGTLLRKLVQAELIHDKNAEKS